MVTVVAIFLYRMNSMNITKKYLSYLAPLIMLVASASSQASDAQAGPYLGIDGSAFSLDGSSDDDLDPRGVRLRLGLPISRVFDVEAHFGFGTEDDIAAFDEIDVVFSSVFLKAHAPLGARTTAYAMAGLTALELTETIGRREFTDEDAGISFGFGLETVLSRRVDLSADYVFYSQDVGIFEDLSAISLGLKLYF